MKKVLREEKKFLIAFDEYIKKSHQLDKVLISDIHNSNSGYMVRSLYFDTIFDDDFFNKQAGVDIRRKIRLRIYDPNQDFAMLEMKQKQGTYQFKRSLRISREDAKKIINGDLSVLLSYSSVDCFAIELYTFMLSRCYRPCTIVQYNRKAFIAKENNIRITFDTNIVATESSFDLFSENLNMVPIIDSYNVVMEIKFNGFLLEYIQKLINSFNRSELSISKYVLARSNSYNICI